MRALATWIVRLILAIASLIALWALGWRHWSAIVAAGAVAILISWTLLGPVSVGDRRASRDDDRVPTPPIPPTTRSPKSDAPSRARPAARRPAAKGAATKARG